MKSLIRRMIPRVLWDTGRYIRSYSIGSRHSVPLWSVIAVAFKEFGGSRGILDYTKKNIYIVLDSFTELARLTPYKKEPKTVAWIEQVIAPGDVFYDIGANVGAYALIAHAHTKGKVISYAFEPNPFTFVSLSRNIVNNNAGGAIIPMCIALSHTTTISSFTYSHMSPGSAQHVLHNSLQTANNDVQPVLVYTLDECIQTFSLPTPNAMKIDVDGVEKDVLAGATQTLSQKSLRSVIIEIDITDQSYVTDIESILSKAGFTLKEKHPLGKGTSKTLFNCVFTRIQ